jgi:hypothetical protein
VGSFFKEVARGTGWGANPGPLDFIFLFYHFSPLYRRATAAECSGSWLSFTEQKYSVFFFLLLHHHHKGDMRQPGTDVMIL